MRTTLILIILSSALLLSGCAVALGPQVGTFGVLYTGISGPVAATSMTDVYTKGGSATYVNVLGLVAVGNASIEKAMRNGGITKIHHVDYATTGVLGLFSTTKVMVYGD
ncbi:MAG: TRL-like protein family [Candidatus Zixiibacteriota bacterium]|nr:MAG: TRL-like protein family [candidate division Zixibacteria bacterium]